jgi:hypothetical protein
VPVPATPDGQGEGQALEVGAEVGADVGAEVGAAVVVLPGAFFGRTCWQNWPPNPDGQAQE